jgi:hypothetical protein
MLTLPEKILFVLLMAASLYYAYTGFRRVYLAIRRGRPEDRFDRLPQRIGRALWLTLTQRTVFKRRPLVSLLHAFVFYGFVYYLLVNLVDLLEGLFGLHARGGFWNPYNLIADLLTALILVGILGLMLRRYVVAPRDFTWNSKVPLHEKVRQGIPRDSAIVGAFITFHVGSRLLSKAFQLAQEEPDPFQPVASALAGALSGLSPRAFTFLGSTSSGGAPWAPSSSSCPTSPAPSTST